MCPWGVILIAGKCTFERAKSTLFIASVSLRLQLLNSQTFLFVYASTRGLKLKHKAEQPRNSLASVTNVFRLCDWQLLQLLRHSTFNVYTQSQSQKLTQIAGGHRFYNRIKFSRTLLPQDMNTKDGNGRTHVWEIASLKRGSIFQSATCFIDTSVVSSQLRRKVCILSLKQIISGA